MTRVKICGITNLKDALCAIEYGANALGFVFYEKSSRYIEPKKALEIVQQLPPFIERVGLFVNKTATEINTICKDSHMSLAQIHFEADESLYTQLELPYLQVIRATCKEDILKLNDKYVIVDAFVQSYGGEGKRVDISWFDGVDCSKIILAGGLNAENIEEVKGLNFYGLDVSSGVELTKGKKDCKKIEEFLKRAKN
ncbi:phosphoribosylanthranilate isomerase [Sulfurospirillum arcachonense]|uniref:phosphoribosylanthranilate isomerase n=1 Tax=Sulfurospirillum arcachonense TaxID=57666 RepID=UPI0004692DC5|nr:phosphoribosylanthranilate isomerase [Sulfurospirillum arcachonense]